MLQILGLKVLQAACLLLHTKTASGIPNSELKTTAVTILNTLRTPRTGAG